VIIKGLDYKWFRFRTQPKQNAVRGGLNTVFYNIFPLKSFSPLIFKVGNPVILPIFIGLKGTEFFFFFFKEKEVRNATEAHPMYPELFKCYSWESLCWK
jgi:hypothetical protein